jgi:hypothetical protein
MSRYFKHVGILGRFENISICLWNIVHSDFFSGCTNQEIGRTSLSGGLIIGTFSYFGADSATKKITDRTFTFGVQGLGSGKALLCSNFNSINWKHHTFVLLPGVPVWTGIFGCFGGIFWG